MEGREELAERFPCLLFTFDAGFRSLMSVPLTSRGQVIGGLGFWLMKPKGYTGESLRLAEKVGHEIAGAIANAQLFMERKRTEETLRKSEGESRRLAQENAIMAEIGRIVTSTLKIEEIYERFSEKVRQIIPFDRITINRNNFTENILSIQYTAGIDIPDRKCGDSFPFHGSVNERVASTRSGVINQVADEDEIGERFPPLLPLWKAGIRSTLSVPLFSKQEVAGCLHLQSTRLEAYTERDLKLAERVGHQIAGALVNAELFAERKRAEEQVKASLAEKEVLLKEIHHRVKNNLQVISSLLKLQSQHLDDKQAEEIFKECQNRVKSMALVHEKLYQSRDLAKIDFAEYVRNLVAHVFRSYPTSLGNVGLKVNVDTISFSIDLAIPLGLLINELVSNCLKHAFPDERKGEIRVDLHPDGRGQYVLTVSDNGVGFPGDVDFRNTETLGLQLVNTLTGQLDGAVEILRNGGTEFRITFHA
jgi:two-component sensor histidine kinase